jgi:outer membrane lipoprotein carrier protein
MRRSFLTVLLLTAAGTGARAADPLADVLARMEQAEREVQTMTFDFVQDIRLTVTGESKQARGTATFQRPNRFRVEMKGAQEQTVVSDGTTFWLYNPSRRQAVADRWENWARSAGFPEGLTPFQMTPAQMKTKYDISLDNGADGDLARLVFKPKTSGALAYTLRVSVDRRTGLPVRTVLESSSVTSITTVSRSKVNPALSTDVFRFVPPSGVDVITLPSFEEKAQ